MGGGISYQTLEPLRVVPHARTLRKAREQVKWMVEDGVSRRQIKHYLCRWLCWWVNTSGTWNHKELSDAYIQSCWDLTAAANAANMLQRYTTELRTDGHASVTELAIAA